jgi:predicted glycosyltransferase
MNIWFDISNSPHVHMWNGIIDELKARGHNVIITSRPLANTIFLLDQFNIQHTVVGNHYGKNLFKKLFGFPVRIFQLWRFLKDKKINVAVSQSSFHSPIVAFLLRVPSIYTNDNEHAKGNIPAFIFATSIFIPESMKFNPLLRLLNFKIHVYPGIKEGIYLWKSAQIINSLRNSDVSKLSRIYVRPEPSTAQYYVGKLNFLDELLKDLDNKIPVTVLTRNNEQFKHYCESGFNSISVPEKPISFQEIASDCLLFIGAGGSMTREMAIVGVPTISVYQDKLLGVDEELVNTGKMTHEVDLDYPKVQSFIKTYADKPLDNTLMLKGKEAYEMIFSKIANYQN